MANECDIDSLMTSGKFREAAELATSLIKGGKSSAILHDKMSRCADHLGWYRTAYEHASTAMDLEPTAERQIISAYTAFMSGAEEEGWAQFFELRTKGVDASPQLVKIAKSLFARSLTTQAKLLLDEAINHDAANFEAHMWLGHCHYVFSNFAEAIEHYDLAQGSQVEVNPILQGSRNYAVVAEFFSSESFSLKTNENA